MPSQQSPALQSFGDEKPVRHIVSASWIWDSDTPVDIQLGALQVVGSSFIIDPTAFGNAGIGPFKALNFSASFSTTDAGTASDEDGSLYVYSQSTGQLVTLSPQIQSLGVGLFQPVKTVSGVIPILAHKGGKIIIAKSANESSAAVFGSIFLSLYDFTVPPFITSGYGYGLIS